MAWGNLTDDEIDTTAYAKFLFLRSNRKNGRLEAWENPSQLSSLNKAVVRSRKFFFSTLGKLQKQILESHLDSQKNKITHEK